MTRTEEDRQLVKGLYERAKQCPENYTCPKCGRKMYINPRGRIKCRCGYAEKD